MPSSDCLLSSMFSYEAGAESQGFLLLTDPLF